MKKFLFLAVAIVALQGALQGQEEVFPLSNAKWTQVEIEGEEPEYFTYTYYSYFLEGDRIINDIWRRKLYYCDFKHPEKNVLLGCILKCPEPSDVSVGSVDESSTDSFCFYPNPVKDRITVEAKDTFLPSKTTVEIVDASGRIFLRKNMENSTLELQVKDLPKGTYSAGFIGWQTTVFQHAAN